MHTCIFYLVLLSSRSNGGALGSAMLTGIKILHLGSPGLGIVVVHPLLPRGTGSRLRQVLLQGNTNELQVSAHGMVLAIGQQSLLGSIPGQGLNSTGACNPIVRLLRT